MRTNKLLRRYSNEYKDFNLDLVEVSKSNTGASARITSYSLCTPGCITGRLMGCQFQSAGCNVHVHISK
ncbi:MAG: gallidermin/nisin family lantibiotic [Turicibacter sp.]